MLAHPRAKAQPPSPAATRGFVLKFNSEGRQAIDDDPDLRFLLPFFDSARDAKANTFVLSALVIPPSAPAEVGATGLVPVHVEGDVARARPGRRAARDGPRISPPHSNLLKRKVPPGTENLGTSVLDASPARHEVELARSSPAWPPSEQSRLTSPRLASPESPAMGGAVGPHTGRAVRERPFAKIREGRTDVAGVEMPLVQPRVQPHPDLATWQRDGTLERQKRGLGSEKIYARKRLTTGLGICVRTVARAGEGRGRPLDNALPSAS